MNISLSIIIPFFNEEDVLIEFHNRIKKIITQMKISYELIYVNDGSHDNSVSLVQNWINQEDNIILINLSRNFGKEIAMTAGLDHSQGDFIVVIDADLQDPPELIAELYQKIINSDFDIIYGKRISREGETWFKKLSAKFFYRFINQISDTKIPLDTGDFRIMSRRTVDAVCKIRERNRFMKGLFSWIGYKQGELLYHRQARNSGESKWKFRELYKFAKDGIISFSFFPLKLATYLGLIIAFLSFTYAIFIIIDTILYGNSVAGYPSLMVVILFIGGVQLLSIGILGSYMGRLFDETRQRPLYFLKTDLVKSKNKEKLNEYRSAPK